MLEATGSTDTTPRIWNPAATSAAALMVAGYDALDATATTLDVAPVGKPSMKCAILLNQEIEKFYSAGGVKAFKTAIAQSLEIQTANVFVTGVFKGSTIVKYEITDPADETANLKLVKQRQDNLLTYKNGKLLIPGTTVNDAAV